MHPLPGFVLRALLVATLVAAAWWPALDTNAEAQVEAGLKRALIAYAVARGLNGVISVAQGTEVAIQPAGLGVVLAPGEILDPVNDLVEQFSSVMLVAAASLGLQRLLIGMSGWAPLVLAITIVAVLWLFASITRVHRVRHAHGTAPHEHALAPPSRLALLLQGALVVLLALRFAVPLAALMSEGAYRIFLEPEYEQSRIELDAAKDALGRSTEALTPPAPADEGLIDRTRRFFDEAGEAFDVEARIEALQTTAAAIVRNIIDLIAIFVVQTVILPLLFLWLGWLGVTRGLPRLFAVTRPA